MYQLLGLDSIQFQDQIKTGLHPKVMRRYSQAVLSALLLVEEHTLVNQVDPKFQLIFKESMTFSKQLLVALMHCMPPGEETVEACSVATQTRGEEVNLFIGSRLGGSFPERITFGLLPPHLRSCTVSTQTNEQSPQLQFFVESSIMRRAILNVREGNTINKLQQLKLEMESNYKAEMSERFRIASELQQNYFDVKDRTFDQINLQLRAKNQRVAESMLEFKHRVYQIIKSFRRYHQQFYYSVVSITIWPCRSMGIEIDSTRLMSQLVETRDYCAVLQDKLMSIALEKAQIQLDVEISKRGVMQTLHAFDVQKFLESSLPDSLEMRPEDFDFIRCFGQLMVGEVSNRVETTLRASEAKKNYFRVLFQRGNRLEQKILTKEGLKEAGSIRNIRSIDQVREDGAEFDQIIDRVLQSHILKHGSTSDTGLQFYYRDSPLEEMVRRVQSRAAVQSCQFETQTDVLPELGNRFALKKKTKKVKIIAGLIGQGQSNSTKLQRTQSQTTIVVPIAETREQSRQSQVDSEKVSKTSDKTHMSFYQSGHKFPKHSKTQSNLSQKIEKKKEQEDSVRRHVQTPVQHAASKFKNQVKQPEAEQGQARFQERAVQQTIQLRNAGIEAKINIQKRTLLTHLSEVVSQFVFPTVVVRLHSKLVQKQSANMLEINQEPVRFRHRSEQMGRTNGKMASRKHHHQPSSGQSIVLPPLVQPQLKKQAIKNKPTMLKQSKVSFQQYTSHKSAQPQPSAVDQGKVGKTSYFDSNLPAPLLTFKKRILKMFQLYDTMRGKGLGPSQFCKKLMEESPEIVQEKGVLFFLEACEYVPTVNKDNESEVDPQKYRLDVKKFSRVREERLVELLKPVIQKFSQVVSGIRLSDGQTKAMVTRVLELHRTTCGSVLCPHLLRAYAKMQSGASVRSVLPITMLNLIFQ